MHPVVRLAKRNWFLLGLLAAVGAGLCAPGAGAVLNARNVASTAAVVGIFVLSGLALPTEQIRRGLGQLRVHLLVQGFVFGVAPAWFALTAGWLSEAMGGSLLLGVYALAAFPTTISSCIVLTQLAGGNAAVTVFNAVLANLAGVVVSPLLLALLAGRAGAPLPADRIGGILLGLALKVLLPFAAGQLLRLPLRAFAQRNARRLAAAGGWLILWIVFLAFSRAADSPLLRREAPRLGAAFAYLGASNLLLMAAAWGAARLLRLGRAEAVSVLFAAPQKTLAMGVPLLSTFFAHRPDVLGAAMIPILFYHPFQLLSAGLARSLLARGSPPTP